METLILNLGTIAILLLLIGGVWMLVTAFDLPNATWWVVGMVVLGPFAHVAYVIRHWERARKPFYLVLCAIALVFIAYYVPIQN